MDRRNGGENAFSSLHRDVNRLFDDAFRGFDLPAEFSGFGSAAGWPRLEISDVDKEIRVFAEIPGMEEKDVEVLLQEGVLTMRGEKKAETEDIDRHFTERYYGHFERSINVGTEIEPDKVSATFKNGVLKVVLPKTEQSKSQTKRIAVRSH